MMFKRKTLFHFRRNIHPFYRILPVFFGVIASNNTPVPKKKKRRNRPLIWAHFVDLPSLESSWLFCPNFVTEMMEVSFEIMEKDGGNHTSSIFKCVFFECVRTPSIMEQQLKFLTVVAAVQKYDWTRSNEWFWYSKSIPKGEFLISGSMNPCFQANQKGLLMLSFSLMHIHLLDGIRTIHRKPWVLPLVKDVQIHYQKPLPCPRVSMGHQCTQTISLVWLLRFVAVDQPPPMNLKSCWRALSETSFSCLSRGLWHVAILFGSSHFPGRILIQAEMSCGFFLFFSDWWFPFFFTGSWTLNLALFRRNPQRRWHQHRFSPRNAEADDQPGQFLQCCWCTNWPRPQLTRRLIN